MKPGRLLCRWWRWLCTRSPPPWAVELTAGINEANCRLLRQATRLVDMQDALDQLLALAQRSATREGRIEMDVQGLIDKTTALTSVTDSVKTVADEIIAQEAQIAADLKAALANQDQAGLQAVADALDANVAKLTTERDAIAAAVAANTVAQP
jgi:hypothetical protein